MDKNKLDKNEHKCCFCHDDTIRNNNKNENNCCEREQGELEHSRHGHGEAHCHSCGCGHSHEHGEKTTSVQIISYTVGAAILLLAFLGEFGHLNKYAAIACAIVVYAFFAKDVWVGAFNDLSQKKIFTEFTLMCIATVGAIVLGEFADAAAVIYLYSLGERISGEAYTRSKRNISELIEITEENVTVVSGGTAKTLPAAEVNVGDVISVRVGDKIALDGVVVEGNGFADTAAITGESVPRELVVGSKCLSGFTLLSGAIYIKVEEKYEASTASKLKAAVERASRQKAVREKRITRFASVFTPIAFCVAVVVLFASWLINGNFVSALRSSLVVLVASCPCSLVLSVPLAYFSGIGRAAKMGIVFRGGQTIDNVAELGTLVFDKTGTLTSASPVFAGVIVAENSPLSKTQLLDMSKSALLKSPHASARSFCEKYAERVSYAVDGVKNIGGRGLVCLINGKKSAFGNQKLMGELGVKVPSIDKSGIYVAVEGVYCGVLVFEAELKKNALSHVSELRANGAHRVVIMSGDNEKTVKSVADKISVSEYYSELKPDEKLARLEYIYKEEKRLNPRRSVGFCGDGLNDSAAIARADVGIAMGSGSALTVESADVVIIDDDLGRLGDMVSIAKKTVSAVNQNIAISLGAKIAVVLMGIFWYPSLELAVVADVGTAVVTVLNAMRIGKSRK